MPEEQRRILEMLAARQITIEEADQLLVAFTAAQTPASPRPSPQYRTGTYRVERRETPAGRGTDGGAYLSQMRAAGLRNLQPHELIALKANGVDSDYVAALRASGLADLESHNLIALKANGVDGEYVEELRAAGLHEIQSHELIAL